MSAEGICSARALCVWRGDAPVVHVLGLREAPASSGGEGKGVAAGGDGGARRRHYYADGPPKLTKRQAELYGLVAYDGYAGNTVEDLAQ